MNAPKNGEQNLPGYLKIALSYTDVIKISFSLKKKKKGKSLFFYKELFF